MYHLDEFIVPEEDIITTDRILSFCLGLSDTTQYIKTDYLFHQPSPIIQMNHWRNINKDVDLRTLRVLVTGHSDYPITESQRRILDLPSLQKWFGQNMRIAHSKAVQIPIGISNTCPGCSGCAGCVVDSQQLCHIAALPKPTNPKLAYLNFSAANCPQERDGIIEEYADKDWVTYQSPSISEAGHRNFLEMIHSHKFVFAPRGNGIDTHRMWEALYLRTIPIVKRTEGLSQFEDLPILFVDSWQDISPQWLEKQYEEIMSTKYPLDKLTLRYWCRRIAEASRAEDNSQLSPSTSR